MGRKKNEYGEGEITTLIRRHLGEEREKPVPQQEQWFRVSGLSYVCSREEALASRKHVERKDKISSNLKVIFEHGHALHWCMQNKILPDLGPWLFRGRWRCAICGLASGGREDPWVFGTFTTEEFVSAQLPRFERCPGCDKEMSSDTCLYEEQTFEHKGHLLSGHSDGFLAIDGLDGLGILEAKSINPKGASQMRMCPSLDHVVQAHCYMWLTGLRWAKILYWDKSGSGVSSFVEHTIEYDESTIVRVESLLKEVRSGLDPSKPLPARICASRVCERAKKCDLVDYCFFGDT